VHVLLGGDHTDIAVNAVLGLPADDGDRPRSARIAELAAAGLERISAGYSTLKIKVGHDLNAECELISAIRSEAPAGVTIFADANQAWRTPKPAIGACEALYDAGAEWIEQPVLARDLEGLRRVTDASRASIIADEAAITPADALAVARLGAADMLNIKLAKAGGLRAGRDVLAVAQAANMPCLLGSMVEGALGMLANYHFARAHDFVTCGFSVYADVADDIDVGLVVGGGRLRKRDANLPGLGYDSADPFEQAFTRPARSR
jgi:L-Ala-D/L-Glu epimerase